MTSKERRSEENSLRQPIIPKPYCSLGAGRLTSFLWKTGDPECGWRYQFNIFRQSVKSGRVSQLFGPADLMHFVKLTQVMASVIADDGCLSQVDRGVLRRLAADLDELIIRAAKPAAAHRASGNEAQTPAPPTTKESQNDNSANP